jgi:hypothetical protein
MAKLLSIESSPDVFGAYCFHCPGCKNYHAVYIKPHQAPNGASWTFNGDMEKPTFSPSILQRVQLSSGKVMICHIFVKDGLIQFLDDCTHELAGSTVEMIDED